MKRSRIVVLMFIIAITLSFVGKSFTAQAATDGITTRINQLRNKFPNGKYWNHQRKVSGDDGDSLLYNWNNSYADSVTDTPCYTHNGVAPIGQYDCNAFDGAIQCYGFANKMFYDIFGEHCCDLSRRTDINNISIGDHIRFTSWGDNGHSAIVIARNGDTLTLAEGNYGNHCMIKWDRTVSLSGSGICGFYHASNWQTIYNQGLNGTLDVNGLLDGGQINSLGSYGTCDVYINGALAANDCSDYCQELATGTRYEIKDVKAKDGYSYDGLEAGSLSGTVSAGTVTNVWLKFNSCKLAVSGLLDGKSSVNTSGYGTFDVYVNGQQAADDVTQYNARLSKGATYEIKDIKASDGHKFSEASEGSLTGTIASGTKKVVLKFDTTGEASGDWTYSDFLPVNITSNYCDIEYNNMYEKTATSSPGSGWKNAGIAKEEWQNSGGVYSSPRDLDTSESRVLVSSIYYHFCGPNAGNVGNYEQSGNFVHYDWIEARRVSAQYLGDDNGHPYYFLTLDGNRLWCQSGVTCDGSYGTHGARCQAWYKSNEYQNRVKVTYYKFTKESGWTNRKDSSATTVKYRYKLKDAVKPVISSAEVTGISPRDYTITVKAADDTGIAKVKVTYWIENETEEDGKDVEIVPDTVEKTQEISITVPSSSGDTGYLNKVYVYDQAGNVSEYADTVRAYVPVLARSSKKLDLPDDLKVIEESAFEGDMGFGEAILPEGVEEIGKRAFADCSRLLVVYLPDSVTTIGEDAFAGSDNVVLLCESNNAAAAYAREAGIPYLTSE